MATIKVQRTTQFLNRASKFQFYINGQFVWSTYFNSPDSIEVEPGFHTVMAKSLWISSPELSFEISEDETKTFEVGVFKLMKYAYFLIALMMVMPFIQAGAFSKYYPYLLIPTIFIILYYTTLGRKEYFTIKEVK